MSLFSVLGLCLGLCSAHVFCEDEVGLHLAPCGYFNAAQELLILFVCFWWPRRCGRCCTVYV